MPDRHSMVLQIDHARYVDRGTIEGQASAPALPGEAPLSLRQNLFQAIKTPLMTVPDACLCSRASAVQ